MPILALVNRYKPQINPKHFLGIQQKVALCALKDIYVFLMEQWNIYRLLVSSFLIFQHSRMFYHCKKLWDQLGTHGTYHSHMFGLLAKITTPIYSRYARGAIGWQLHDLSCMIYL